MAKVRTGLEWDDPHWDDLRNGKTPGQAVGQPATTPGALGRGFGDPSKYFGEAGTNNPFWNIGAGDNRQGAGQYNLPPAFGGWGGPARYALGPSLGFADDAQPAIDMLGKEMGKDYEKDLYGAASDAADTQFSEAGRKRDQAYAQTGYGGGGQVSPFAAQQLQLEGAARAGTMGKAAQQSVMQAQQMKTEASRNYLNAISQRMQALLTPAVLQGSQQGSNPIGPSGPSYIGPAINLGASMLGAFA